VRCWRWLFGNKIPISARPASWPGFRVADIKVMRDAYTGQYKGFASRPGFRVFFFTPVTGPRRSLSLKLSDIRVYAPQIRIKVMRGAYSGQCKGFAFALFATPEGAQSNKEEEAATTPHGLHARPSSWPGFSFCFITLKPRVE